MPTRRSTKRSSPRCSSCSKTTTSSAVAPLRSKPNFPTPSNLVVWARYLRLMSYRCLEIHRHEQIREELETRSLQRKLRTEDKGDHQGPTASEASDSEGHRPAQPRDTPARWRSESDEAEGDGD